jgi:RNA polymerase sigma factor (sigma-70 family)
VNGLSDQRLLRDYTERRSEAAFAELVRRHIDLVYSAAVRMVRDGHLAEDVTQAVFMALAHNARPLADCHRLSGWLHRTAQNLAANAVRSEVRRRAREQEAAAMHELLSPEPDALWERIAPHLDAAVGELGEADRDALLLRFFERQSAREMAQTLGISDEAAQKRVNRAVDRLREFLAKRGVTVGASALAILLSAHAVQAAPVGLAAAVAAVSGLAGTMTTAAIASPATLNWINLKSIAAIVVSSLVVGTATYLVQQAETTALRAQHQKLIAQQAQLMKDRDAAWLVTKADQAELARSRVDKSELLRLRGEVGLLRRQSSALTSSRTDNARLQAQAQPQTASDQATNRPPVVAKIIVTRIQQPQTLSEEQIRTNLSLQVGDFFSREAIDLDVRGLYASGLFHNVRVIESREEDGITLNFCVQEKPTVTGIRFTGNTHYREADLAKSLASRVGEPFDQRTLFGDVERLRELCKESGFPAAKIKIVSHVNESAGTGEVTFEITE